MGLFDIFNKNKSKKVQRIEEHFSETGDLLGEIIDLASNYSYGNEDNLLNKYSNEGLEIVFINKVRSELEGVLLDLGKSLKEYYNNEYVTAEDSKGENKSFAYSLDALVVLFNNSLDLYLENEEVRDTLNFCYKVCNVELEKVKEILSDDKAIEAFTGIKKKVVVEEIINEESREEEEVAIEEREKETAKEVYEESFSEVDGDIIIDTDKIKLYFIRISRDEEERINLNLCIENKLDSDIKIEIKDVTVEACKTIPSFNCNVLAKSIVYEKMVFENNVEQLVNFKGTFLVIDSNLNKVIDEYKISMFDEE